MQVRHKFIILLFRFAHKKIGKEAIQKFIRDNEKYVLDIKRKKGKTKIDKDIEEYLRKKSNINLFNNNNNMNTNNYNVQMMNNSLLAMNFLLLQNQILLQNNQSSTNPINGNLAQQNKDETNINENMEKNYNQSEQIDYSNLNNFGPNFNESDKNKNINEEERHFGNEEVNQNKEIIQKILEAINNGKNNNINNNEENQADPRKK
jgi:hypothetical protein